MGWRPSWLQGFARGGVVVALMVGIRAINKESQRYLYKYLSRLRFNYAQRTVSRYLQYLV